jgi:putative transcription factor
MANCEICGRDEELSETIIEGTKLNVCSKCTKFGKVIKKQAAKEEPAKAFRTNRVTDHNNPNVETVELINPRYAELIKKKREDMGLKQIELAKKIAEKESMIHNLESGHTEPSIAVAKKLERLLGISLIKEEKLEKTKANAKPTGLTIGDIINVK